MKKVFHSLFSRPSGWVMLFVVAFICGVTLSSPMNSFYGNVWHIPIDVIKIQGPERICLVTGNVNEEFFGGGVATSDLFRWIVIDPDGEERIASGGATFQTLEHTFSKPGNHEIRLTVLRGGVVIGTDVKFVRVIDGAIISLEEGYIICQGQNFSLSAIETTSADFGDYRFEWLDDSGTQLGVNNTLVVNTSGIYRVRYWIENAIGEPECINELQTEIEIAADFNLVSDEVTFCPGGNIRIKPSVEMLGNWFYSKDGAGQVFIEETTELDISVTQLDGFGDYRIIFEMINVNNPDCEPTGFLDITYADFPRFTLTEAAPASGCFINDGEITIEAGSLINSIYYVINDSTISDPFPMTNGQSITLSGFASGVYTFKSFLGDCEFSEAVVVNLNDIPPSLNFEIDPDSIIPETCGELKKNKGGFKISFEEGPINVYYDVLTKAGDLNQTDTIQFVGTGPYEQFVEVDGGEYFVEIYQIPDDPDDEKCLIPFREEVLVPSLPLVDFSVPANFSFCESYELIPQTNQNLEFVLINLTSNDTLVGTSFIIEEQGKYEVIGRHLDNPEGICPKKIELDLTFIPAVEFTPELAALTCQGTQTWKVNLQNGVTEDQVRIRWYDPDSVVVSTNLTMIPATFGEYQLDIQPRNILGRCPDPPLKFNIEPAVLNVPVDLVATPLCPNGEPFEITLDTDFDNVGRITWRFFDEDGNPPQILNEFEGSAVISADKPGTYEAIVYNNINDQCDIGFESIDVVLSDNLVQFDVPDEELIVCERFEWKPESNEPLIYTVIYPNGEQITKEAGEFFVLNQRGEYTVIGFSPDPQVCNTEKKFLVDVKNPISFEAELLEQTCDGSFTYKANIGNTNPADAIFTWRNESGEMVGSEEFFETSIPGIYTLEVQPANSLPCDIEVFEFEIVTPVLDIDVNLSSDLICPDADFTVIILDSSDDNEIASIEWLFIDINNNTIELGQFKDLNEIVAEEEGTYEAIVYNRLNCRIGDDRILIMRSMDDVRPEVKELYQICAEYEIGETINPGNFSTYSWFLGEDLVSTSPTFKPQMVGEYTLVVNSQENCEYTITFEVEEECELRISHPNAMIPGISDRNFLIYTNYLIDELDIWIFNKWGQEVFTCSERNLQENSTSCIWDGYYNGKKLPIGSYAVRIHYKNNQEGIEETRMTTLTVIE